MNGIRKALHRGEWSEYVIKNWSDLLTYLFKENKQKKT